MWIDFSATNRYAIRIFAGGVNAISGEPEVATPASITRLKEKMRRGQAIQDYVVVPEQLWLDGVAIAPGEVRQFVAMPMGSGHSIEAQVTGQEVNGGLHLEITPMKEFELEEPNADVIVTLPTGDDLTLPVALSWEVWNVKDLLQDLYPGLNFQNLPLRTPQGSRLRGNRPESLPVVRRMSTHLV
jgi:hypothetical protein